MYVITLFLFTLFLIYVQLLLKPIIMKNWFFDASSISEVLPFRHAWKAVWLMFINGINIKHQISDRNRCDIKCWVCVHILREPMNNIQTVEKCQFLFNSMTFIIMPVRWTVFNRVYYYTVAMDVWLYSLYLWSNMYAAYTHTHTHGKTIKIEYYRQWMKMMMNQVAYHIG